MSTVWAHRRRKSMEVSSSPSGAKEQGRLGSRPASFHHRPPNNKNEDKGLTRITLTLILRSLKTKWLELRSSLTCWASVSLETPFASLYSSEYSGNRRTLSQLLPLGGS